MFVSSFSTYISTTANERVNKPKLDSNKNDTKSFTSTLAQSKPLQAYSNTHNIPIDYISNYKSFANQQKLQEQEKSKNEIKFKKISDIENAKNAYESNSFMFSLISVPKNTLNQTLKSTNNFPQDIQNLKENNMKHKMVNTYLANDKYYQITA